MSTGIELINLPVAVWVAVIFGLVRVITGWAENALRDGKVEAFEVRHLIGTVAGYVGLIFVVISGLDVPPEMAGGFAYVLDMVRTAIKGRVNK